MGEMPIPQVNDTPSNDYKKWKRLKCVVCNRSGLANEIFQLLCMYIILKILKKCKFIGQIHIHNCYLVKIYLKCAVQISCEMDACFLTTDRPAVSHAWA